MSKAEINSHDAEIFIMPVNLFSKKFNPLTNFYLTNKLKGLVETKKKLIAKAITSKR